MLVIIYQYKDNWRASTSTTDTLYKITFANLYCIDSTIIFSIDTGSFIFLSSRLLNKQHIIVLSDFSQKLVFPMFQWFRHYLKSNAVGTFSLMAKIFFSSKNNSRISTNQSGVFKSISRVKKCLVSWLTGSPSFQKVLQGPIPLLCYDVVKSKMKCQFEISWGFSNSRYTFHVPDHIISNRQVTIHYFYFAIIWILNHKLHFSWAQLCSS